MNPSNRTAPPIGAVVHGHLIHSRSSICFAVWMFKHVFDDCPPRGAELTHLLSDVGYQNSVSFSASHTGFLILRFCGVSVSFLPS